MVLTTRAGVLPPSSNAIAGNTWQPPDRPNQLVCSHIDDEEGRQEQFHRPVSHAFHQTGISTAAGPGAKFNSLSVFDTVYTNVRGKPFAAR